MMASAATERRGQVSARPLIAPVENSLLDLLHRKRSQLLSSDTVGPEEVLMLVIEYEGQPGLCASK
jgi:hypothetical protein